MSADTQADETGSGVTTASSPLTLVHWRLSWCGVVIDECRSAEFVEGAEFLLVEDLLVETSV
jgi:hypothetical protein